ncbi:AAA family ATPase [Clostridium oryzae]|uniref:endopeptidase La n=1 Tax=Clostridium oryzae TaxID=1450648 RepID=A0A1V4IT93_9CLOT|nr:AAA family ATPase [Clostridium oryzae]OPJ63251.1 Lon protease [Clostridium oryzae]
MDLALKTMDIVYKVKVPEVQLDDKEYSIPQYDSVLDELERTLLIDESNYNIYLVDEYSEEKIEKIVDKVQAVVAQNEIRDICYAIYDDIKAPRIITLKKGFGNELKNSLDDLKNYYLEVLYDFYNRSTEEKDKIMEGIQIKRSRLLESLVEMAKQEGFKLKPSSSGFVFLPDEDDTSDSISFDEEKYKAINKLKQRAREILEDIKNCESDGLQKIKENLLKFVTEEMNIIKAQCFKTFEDQSDALRYLKYVCENIEKNVIDIFSGNIEDDEDKIISLISKYNINVIVDNSKIESPQVIYEEDPTLQNLIGTVDYDISGGNYVWDVSMIKAGTILKCYGGCVIVRARDIFSSVSSYLYLKKVLLNHKLKMDFNKIYMEMHGICIDLEPISINTRFIVIGDYETYNILYNGDEDFKYIFNNRIQYDNCINNTEENRKKLAQNLNCITIEKKLLNLNEAALHEVFRHLSKKVEDRDKLFYDDMELKKICLDADSYARKRNSNHIEAVDIARIDKYEDLVEKHLLENYEQNYIRFNVEDKCIGSVNGLSVIDLGYMSFGRPLKITCSCYKGDGNIMDVQKESNLSGNIHNKSVNILKGLISKMLGEDVDIPFDFNVSFEQVYGKVEGDSASVAELLSIISSLSKIPIRQSIAVTGSVNQFGDIQAVGGINEKIEGFYKLCNIKGKIDGKGVLIPKSNLKNLVLDYDIEKQIIKSKFSIYIMESIEDALEVMMGSSKISSKDIIDAAIKEAKKISKSEN